MCASIIDRCSFSDLDQVVRYYFEQDVVLSNHHYVRREHKRCVAEIAILRLKIKLTNVVLEV